MKPGIYNGIDNEDYHRSEGFSSTQIKPALVSIKNYVSSLKKERNVTDAIREGTLFHLAVLEPEKFEDAYLLKPDCQKRKKEDKEAHKLHEEKCKELGKISTTQERIDLIKGMQQACRSHPQVSGALRAVGNNEIAAYAIDPITGMLLKAKADRILNLNGKYHIIDLKKTACAEINTFKRQVISLSYDLSAAFYMYVFGLAGIDVDTFAWVACEINEPHNCAIYTADEDRIAIGAAKFKLCLNRIKEYNETKKITDLNDNENVLIGADAWELQKWGL